jgi:hypothetical protein
VPRYFVLINGLEESVKGVMKEASLYLPAFHEYEN